MMIKTRRSVSLLMAALVAFSDATASGAGPTQLPGTGNPEPKEEGGLRRMMFNNPGLTVDLSSGIWPGMALRKGGVSIYTGSVPREIARFYEQTGLTMFKAGVDMKTMGDGVPELRDLDNPGYGFPNDGELGAHFRKFHSHQRRFADMNCDGVLDCLDLYNDWTGYGCPGPKCPVAYDANEKWTNSQIQVFAYWYPRIGGRDGKWGKPLPIASGGENWLQKQYGIGGSAVCDFDGDGDPDLICGDFRSEIWYYENIGTKDRPEFSVGRHPWGTDGKPIEGDLCMMYLRGFDWDGDGRMDLIATEEDGRVSWWRNTGGTRDGMPVFAPQEFFRQVADELKFGCLATPWCVDWDGDGDWDIIAGNSGGYIAFIENLSGPGVEYPTWAEPKLITVKHPERCKVAKWLKGDVIHSWCGDENSPQGPAEAKWGYTVCSVADWDGDGYLDIIANDVKGSVVFIRNPGRKGTTVMEVPRAVEVEWNGKQPTFEWEWRKPTGKVLRAPWRTTPIAYDWTGDGLVDLIMLDHEGIIVLYERAKRGGKLILKHPRRIFIDMKGNPIMLSYGPRGGNGRRKMCVADWNGDGKLDIVVGHRNAVVLINRGKAANGCTRFEQSPNVAEKQLAGHTCCPSVCDFNADGVPDLCIGAEDGHFYYFRHRRQN